nr:N-6 DNA methylase [uncultured Campylobacter sp.]
MFQKSVLDKYIKSIDAELLEQKYKEFQNTYQNPQKIEQIKASKEEQYQEGFLRDIFVNILGYTINPEPNYNLITEKRNESADKKDARKADGAIIIDSKVKCVIELKGTDTTDLAKIENQALGYKAHNAGCRYVVISNFEKLRFYIDDATDFVEFHLFTLDFKGFCELYTLLALAQITADIPAKIKEQSLSREEQITKALYKDYTEFKNALFTDLCEQNKDTDELELFSKSQKLLDRFLFIFFCEDKGLLPPNSMLGIIERFKKAKEIHIQIPLYDLIKQYFGWIDSGDESMDIFAYNGGLFKSDELLDRLKISDEILEFHCQKIANYDFDSDVSVDILGHIFEHSISEIESKKNELTGIKEQNKRKKDGVFYTPAYITKYIVESTLGTLCESKKAELGINENFTKSTKSKKEDKIKTLQAYREYLLGLKICDPACGSGAFLNATLKYLKTQHALLDELENALYGSQLDFSYYDDKILENNIYGVDINGESVEIAKLSLWLNTAKKGTKLSTLSGKIKCGNSLITELFDWQKEFPEVFENGGFDIIVGNPPYVQLQSMGQMSEVYSKCGFASYNKSADLYCLFAERGFNLLKENGLISYIMPNKWMLVDYGKELRKFMATTSLQQILNFGDIQFFADATTYTCIFVTKKSQTKNNVLALSLNKKTYNGDFLQEIPNALQEFPNELFGENEWKIIDNISLKVLEKINTFTPLKSLPIEIYRGILTGFDEAFHINEQIKNELIAKDSKSTELIKPLLRGRDIKAWNSSFELYMINTHNGIKAENLEPINIDDYPAIKEYLSQFYDKLEKRSDKGITPYNLRNCAYLKAFYKPKIIYPEVTSNRPFSYDENGIFVNKTCFILTAKDESISLKFLVAILNSKLTNFWIWHNCPECQGGARNIAKTYFENFGIPNVNLEFQKELADLADIMIDLNAQFAKLTNNFWTLLKANYNVEKIPSALSEFYKLDFKEFLKISKIKVPLSEQGEVLEFFESFKAKCAELNSQLKATDERINTAVYKLYNLSDDEIKVVENS